MAAPNKKNRSPNDRLKAVKSPRDQPKTVNPARHRPKTVKSPRHRPKTVNPTSDRLKTVKPSGAAEDSFFDLVHAVARQIPKGRVTSYGAIAAALGTRLSARMVGWAMLSAHHAQPYVPAHRVVNRQGLLTGRHHYDPPERMQQLLEEDGVEVRDNAVVDFAKRFWDPAKEL
jgi:methylated-DNA-protein-cysteine methyltransferase-like protein